MGSLVRTILIGGTLAALLAPAANAAPRKITHEEFATLGQVTGRLTFLERRRDGHSDYRDVRVSITRAGVPVLDTAIEPPCDPCDVIPAHASRNRRSVHVRDLDGDREPEVVVDIFTGGAHCCDWAHVYAYVPAEARYVLTAHSFGSPHYRLADLQRDSSLEFVTRDKRFESAFSSYAASGFPIQVLRFDHGTFADVTRSFPALIRRDATTWLRFYRRLRQREDVRGVLAAYAADQCLLGKERAAFRLARRAAGRREVRRKYVRSLRRHLRRWGYC